MHEVTGAWDYHFFEAPCEESVYGFAFKGIDPLRPVASAEYR